MSVQIVLDVTADFNASAGVKLDTGGFDYAIVQLVSPSGTVNFEHTNDSGDIQNVSDGSAVSSTNFVTLQGTNLATGTAVSSLAASGIVRFSYYGRYLRLSGTAVTATKVLVRLYKIC
jgi:hypothetical protein